jgi:hypothetical protein
MARLTEKRCADLEQRRLCRSVRIVAVGAVLRDGLVLPEKRPTVFRMTIRAGFRDGVLDQLCWCGRAVRRMAGGARHLALAHRMMRGFEEIGVLRLMTRGTDFNLRRCRSHRIFGQMQRMTACAGHIARCVRTRGPVMCGIRLMAAQALRVLFEGRCERFWAEVDHARQRSASSLHVSPARSVTSLALQSTVAERTVGIIRPRMLGVEQARNGGIAVTGETGVGSLRTEIRTGMRRTIGLRWIIGRERRHAPTQQQSESGGHAGTWKPLHSIRRGGDVVHDLHIGNSAGAVANAASLYACRICTENRAAFGVFRDRGRATVLQHVRSRDRVDMTA